MVDVFDVAIVGYGPTGATLAALLGKRGLRVVVFDKRAEVYPKPRAIGMDHEVMRILQRIGLADAVMRTSVEYQPTVYLGAAGEPIQRINITPHPYPLSWPPTSTFDQPALEAGLRQRVATQPSTTVMLRTEVVECVDQGDMVALRAKSAAGHDVAFQAHYVVCCDGAGSAIRTKLGIEVEDLGFEEEWLVIDVIADDALIARLPATNIQYCDPARPCTYVICPGNHRRWEIKALPGEAFGEDISDEVLYSLLAPWLVPSEARIWRAAGYRFRARVATRWRRGRVFLAGDAAHQMPPFLGQGMCQGIRDAANLDWKLARVLGGQSPDDLLDTYQAERRGHVVDVTKAVIALGKIIGELDPEKAAARDIKLLQEQGGQVQPKIRQAFIPGIQGGVLKEQSAGAGTVFPQPVVIAQGTRARLDEFSHGLPYMVLKSAPDPEKLAALSDLAASSGTTLFSLTPAASGDARIVHVVETESLLSDWFARYQCDTAVVRPDHYVYGTCKNAGDAVQLLEDFLRGLST